MKERLTIAQLDGFVLESICPAQPLLKFRFAMSAETPLSSSTNSAKPTRQKASHYQKQSLACLVKCADYYSLLCLLRFLTLDLQSSLVPLQLNSSSNGSHSATICSSATVCTYGDSFHSKGIIEGTAIEPRYDLVACVLRSEQRYVESPQVQYSSRHPDPTYEKLGRGFAL
jgi:hypothetical protein